MFEHEAMLPFSFKPTQRSHGVYAKKFVSSSLLLMVFRCRMLRVLMKLMKLRIWSCKMRMSDHHRKRVVMMIYDDIILSNGPHGRKMRALFISDPFD